MKWKIFSTAFISLAFFCFPENMIGCGPTEDPFDYYTSFFSHNVIPQKDLSPFYYTGLVSFYIDESEESANRSYNEKIIEEWRSYCKNQPSINEVISFIYSANANDIKKAIDQSRTGNTEFTNTMGRYLVTTKDLAALNYLLLAKQSESVASFDPWEATPKKDSLLINKYISNVQSFLKQPVNDFLKTKFAYQLCKLAFYNSRFADCIQWYDELLSKKEYAVRELGLSYKAGSLFRLGKNKDAAYYFSKLFTFSLLNKKDVFLGFLWSTDYCDPKLQRDYLMSCKNNKEKANMLAMFALHGTQYKLAALREIYSLDPRNEFLPLLVTREIGKLEEKYLTAVLSKEKGGRPYYYAWRESQNLVEERKQLDLLITFLQTAAQITEANTGLYLTGVAYLSFIDKKYSVAKTYIGRARKIPLSDKLKDQLALVDLLVEANAPGKMDAAVEQNILSSLKWLHKKAMGDDEYRKFLRNFFSEILAQRYEQQNEDYKAALAYGFADSSAGWWTGGLDFVQNEMSTEQLIKLHGLLISQKKSTYENFLIGHSSLTKNDVVDMVGTSYLRDFKFSDAITWLKRAPKQDTLTETDYNYTTRSTTTFYPDPFFDYINDSQRYDKKTSIVYTKLTLAQKLVELQKSIAATKDKDAQSKFYYRLATALYNMSFYGNSWKAVDFYRHTSEWNAGEYKTPWKKEYYGVYTTRKYYQKAYELTSNKEFKAACHFQIIKCAQRQIPLPKEYFFYGNLDTDEELNDFWKKFKYNPLFANFQNDFADTKYFNNVTTRCSYLRDFVKKSK